MENEDRVMISNDVWSVIGEFIPIQSLPNILVLKKSINHLIDSNHSWERRCLQEFPPKQVLQIKSWFGIDDFKTIFKELRFRFGNKISKCPNLGRTCSILRDLTDSRDVHSTEPRDFYFTFQMDRMNNFSHRSINLFLRDWFECDRNCCPNINFRIATNLTENGQKGIDIQLGLIRYIFQVWDPQRLENEQDYRVATSTCYGSFEGNMEKRFFTSAFIICSLDIPYPSQIFPIYSIGRATTLIPETEEDINQEICMKLQNYHEKIFGSQYKLNELIKSKFLFSEFRKKSYVSFNFESFELSTEEKIKSKGTLYFSFFSSDDMNTKENGDKMELIKGFYDQNFPEQKTYNLIGSTIESYISLAIFNRDESKNGFFIGGRFLLLKSSSSSVVIKGIVYDAENIRYDSQEDERLHGLFKATPREEEKKLKKK